MEGDPDIRVCKLSRIEEGEPRSLTFLANPRYTDFIYSTGASVVIVDQEFRPEKPLKNDCTLVRVPDAYKGFARLLEYYENQRKKEKKGIEDPVHIADDAEIGQDVFIGAFSRIGNNVGIGDNVIIHSGAFIGDNVTIGEGTEIQAGVKVRDDCRIGSQCNLHTGVVIGSDGFGFAPDAGNNYEKVAQTGNVVIEDQVEVGANSTIDRATLGSTVIRKGVKLDNLIQVAHNVDIGENTVIAAQVGIAGSARIGKNCMIGGQVGIIGHVTIADGVKIAAQTGVGRDIKEEGAVLQGSPALNASEYKRAYISFRKLPDLQKKLEDLEKDLSRSNQEKSSSKPKG